MLRTPTVDICTEASGVPAVVTGTLVSGSSLNRSPNQPERRPTGCGRDGQAHVASDEGRSEVMVWAASTAVQMMGRFCHCICCPYRQTAGQACANSLCILPHLAEGHQGEVEVGGGGRVVGLLPEDV